MLLGSVCAAKPLPPDWQILADKQGLQVRGQQGLPACLPWSMLEGWWVGWLVGWLGAALIGWLVGVPGMTDLLTGWLVGWLVGWLAGWLAIAGRLVGWLVCRSCLLLPHKLS